MNDWDKAAEGIESLSDAISNFCVPISDYFATNVFDPPELSKKGEKNLKKKMFQESWRNRTKKNKRRKR